MLAAVAALAMLAFAGPASAQTIQRVNDPTPGGQFSDAGGPGYVEVRNDGVRGCNQNEATPLGDAFTGYAWIDTGGDANAGHTDNDSDPDGISYGNGTIGAGDYDGETGDSDPAVDNDDCPN
jgi:hypothetical protein